MGNFKSNNRSQGFGNRSGGRSESFGRKAKTSGARAGGRGGFRDRNSGSFGRRPEMHEVTCDKCGKKCEVPFKPTGDKPVFCSDCFRKDSGSSSNFSSRGNSSSPGISQEQYKEINMKLDKILGILESMEIIEEDDEDDEDNEN